MHAQENSKGPLTSSANPIFSLTCPLNALLYRPLVRLNGMRSMIDNVSNTYGYLPLLKLHRKFRSTSREDGQTIKQGEDYRS